MNGVLKHKYFLILLILLLGASLRLFNLTKAVPALSQDELVTGYDSYCLSQNLHDHHGAFLPFIPESFGDWTSPFINYVSMPVAALLGLNDYATRLPVSLLGIASIFLFYVLIQKIFNDQRIALIAAFLLATAPFAISLSRWAVPPSTVPFTMLLFFNTFFWAKDKPTILRFIWVGITAVLVVYSYPTMKLFFPPMVAILGLLYFKDYQWKALPGVILFLVLIAPLYYLALRYPEIYNARFKNISLAASGEPFIAGFITRYISYFLPYFYFGKGDEFMLHHVPGFGSIQEVLAFFSYAGIAFVIANALGKINFIDRRLSIFLLLYFIIAPIPAALTIHKYTMLRNIHTVLLMLIFAVMGIQVILSNIQNQKIQRIIVTGLIVVVMLSTLNFSYYYFKQYKLDAQKDYHYGIKEVFVFLEEHDSEFQRVEINTDVTQDHGILEPYIYYLYYHHIAPGTYDTKEITTHLGKYYFMPVSVAPLLDATPIFVFPYGTQGNAYKVYQKEPGLYQVIQ